MQATANEKQSASSGLIITKLSVIATATTKYSITKISRRDVVFSFLPPQQKGKRKRDSASFAP
jgi:hypothetical protein